MSNSTRSYPHADLIWSNTVRINTPGDGSCLFHALMNAYSLNYRKATDSERKKQTAELRKRLADTLTEKYNDKLTYYDYMNNGAMKEFSKADSSYSLNDMYKALNSKEFIGYGFLHLISLIMNKDIYILNGEKMDIYATDELPLVVTGDRDSIVLYYENSHYETIGLAFSVSGNRSVDTHFSADHPFIVGLRNRIKELPSSTKS